MTEEKQSYGMSENLCEGFMTENLCEGFMTAEQFALQVASIVYDKGKAKTFNVLESILPQADGAGVRKLEAFKRITEDIVSNIAKDMKKFIIDVLGNDWRQPIYFDPDDALSGKEAKEAEEEFDELEEALR